MLNGLTKRKLLRLGVRQAHKKCAELLRAIYLDLLQGRPPSFLDYETVLSWMNFDPFFSLDLKQIANRMHWHLGEAGVNVKEHNLLPRLRTGDRKATAEYLPIAIYLDRIRSAYNVGSILRTNEAFRLGSVHFSERTPFIDNEKVAKTAMGAIPYTTCVQHTPLEALPRPILVFDTSDDALSLNSFDFPTSCTLVFGNEEVGVSDELLAVANAVIEIPLLGIKNSLNVACAFAIVASKIRCNF
jgi:tRNA G18 (ribose-2'-O)-methylase SpoU